MMGNYAGGMGAAGWILMGLLSVTLIVAIVWMIVDMVTKPGRTLMSASSQDFRTDPPASR